MNNFDLNKLPEEDEDVPRHVEENALEFQQEHNNDINLNEVPIPERMPEMMPLSESLLEEILIFTAIYFPLVLRDVME